MILLIKISSVKLLLQAGVLFRLLLVRPTSTCRHSVFLFYYGKQSALVIINHRGRTIQLVVGRTQLIVVKKACNNVYSSKIQDRHIIQKNNVIIKRKHPKRNLSLTDCWENEIFLCLTAERKVVVLVFPSLVLRIFICRINLC